MTEKILIVDDDVDSLKLIGLMLKRQGYDVTVADSGSKALNKANAELPQLIILDVMMPDMNGLDVCRRLRDNPRTTDIPIIMFTAKTLIDDKVKGFEAGADDYLTKPTHPAELANRVKSVLQRKMAEKESKTGAQTPIFRPKQNTLGSLIGVLGVKGGVGTTTVAINIAAAMVNREQRPVLTDLRLGVGSMGLMIGSDVDGMGHLIKTNPLTLEAIRDAIVKDATGLRSIVSSSNPHDAALDFAIDKPLTIVQELKKIAKPVIIDLGNSLTRPSAEIIDKLDKLIYVVEATRIALEMARQQLMVLDNLLGANKISIVVVNRSSSTLPWHEAENRLNREVRAIISPAPELAFQANEKGTAMVFLQPNAMVCGQFVKLADELETYSIADE